MSAAPPKADDRARATGSADTRARVVSVEDLRAGRARLEGGRLVLEASGPSQRRARQVASGEAAEDFLGEHHAACAEASVAYLVKRPTPWRIVGPGPRPGTMLAVPEAVAGVDYTGQLLDGTGRHVAAEAKAARDGRVDLRARLTDSQRQELELAAATGAVAALLVVHRRALYAAPWALVRDRAAVTVARDLGAFLVGAGALWPARWTAGATGGW